MTLKRIASMLLAVLLLFSSAAAITMDEPIPMPVATEAPITEETIVDVPANEKIIGSESVTEASSSVEAVQQQPAQADGIIFDVTDYISGISALELAPYKGKIIALFFYTGASDECLTQLAAWKSVFDAFEPDDLQIILVHAWDGEDSTDTEKHIARYGLEDMTIFEDEDCLLCSTLGIYEYPNTLFLDKNGTPASGYSGQLTFQTISNFLTTLGARSAQ